MVDPFSFASKSVNLSPTSVARLRPLSLGQNEVDPFGLKLWAQRSSSKERSLQVCGRSLEVRD